MIKDFLMLVIIITLVNLICTGKAWPEEDWDDEHKLQPAHVYQVEESDWGMPEGKTFLTVAAAVQAMGCHDIFITQGWFILEKVQYKEVLIVGKNFSGYRKLILREVYNGLSWDI